MLKLGIKNRLPTSRLWEQECLALFVSLICVWLAPIPFARFALSPVYYFVHKCCIPTVHTFSEFQPISQLPHRLYGGRPRFLRGWR